MAFGIKKKLGGFRTFKNLSSSGDRRFITEPVAPALNRGEQVNTAPPKKKIFSLPPMKIPRLSTDAPRKQAVQVIAEGKRVITDAKNNTMALINKKSGFLSSIKGNISFGGERTVPILVIVAVVLVIGFGAVKSAIGGRRKRRR